jgi:hypothetical protein
MYMVAVVAPPAVGEKRTLHEALAPGARVSGRLRPLTAKVPLEVVARVMITRVEARLVNVTVCVSALPTATLPKLTLVGFTLNQFTIRAVDKGQSIAARPSKKTTDRKRRQQNLVSFTA